MIDWEPHAEEFRLNPYPLYRQLREMPLHRNGKAGSRHAFDVAGAPSTQALSAPTISLEVRVDEARPHGRTYTGTAGHEPHVHPA
jgi:hypothetical protein